MNVWFWYVIWYSFLGYCLEKLFAHLTRSPRRVRKSFLLLPLCPVYGIAMAAVVALLDPTDSLLRLALLGGVLGFLPDILTATVVGMKADDRSSPWFWGAIAVNLLVAGGSTLFYTLYRRRHAGPAGDQPAKEN